MAARVTVRLFHELRTSVGQSEIELEADTLNDLVRLLIDRNSALKTILFDSRGGLRGYILFYVNNVVQSPPDLSQKLNDGDMVALIPPAGGG